ncbi:MAG: hypothetical protein DYH07_11225 [Armatimonadetes bacterium ATM1]|nr:hypothetical protein [Armatimonadetes bacterium ATM1]RIJ97188.1 MAG: hypothetical protein DCC45_03890 [Armatimonadota bacterium]
MSRAAGASQPIQAGLQAGSGRVLRPRPRISDFGGRDYGQYTGTPGEYTEGHDPLLETLPPVAASVWLQPTDIDKLWWLEEQLIRGAVDMVFVAGFADDAVRFASLGRLGGSQHRAAVKAYADKLEAQGHKILAGGGRKFPWGSERAVKIKGTNRRRDQDIIALIDGVLHYINVGRVNRRGEPIARELRALEDLANAEVPGVVEFIPLN